MLHHCKKSDPASNNGNLLQFFALEFEEYWIQTAFQQFSSANMKVLFF